MSIQEAANHLKVPYGSVYSRFRLSKIVKKTTDIDKSPDSSVCLLYIFNHRLSIFIVSFLIINIYNIQITTSTSTSSDAGGIQQVPHPVGIYQLSSPSNDQKLTYQPIEAIDDSDQIII